MVKHTQTIRRQQPTNGLIVFDHFVGLALEGLNSITMAWLAHLVVRYVCITRVIVDASSRPPFVREK